MSAMRKGFALKTFRDEGTGKTFEAGKAHDFSPGAYANYEAAGLVRPAEAEGHKASPPATAKSAAA